MKMKLMEIVVKLKKTRQYGILSIWKIKIAIEDTYIQLRIIRELQDQRSI